VPLSVGKAGSPSNTMSPGPRPTSVPSGILIYPAVSSQYTNVTDRTDRQDNGPNQSRLNLILNVVTCDTCLASTLDICVLVNISVSEKNVLTPSLAFFVCFN